MAGEGLSRSHDLNAIDPCKKRACVLLIGRELGLREAVVTGEQVDLVPLLVDPFDVQLAFFVGREVLVWLTVSLEPILRGQNALGLEDLLRMLGHVGDHGIVREVLRRADGFESLLFRHNRLDAGMLDHSPSMCL